MKKLRSKKGFTLVEVLIATAILAMFVSMAIVGTSSLFGTGEKMMTVSKAAVLGSDVMKAVTNEVRFGQDFSLSDGKIKYNSTTYGDNCTMTVKEGQLVVVQTSKASDGTSEDETPSKEKDFFPIGSAAYDEVRIGTIAFDIAESSSERQEITFTVTIIASSGENTLWEKKVTIVPLYQKANS